MKLRARADRLGGQELTAVFTPDREKSYEFPMLAVDGDLIMSLEVALASYDVIDATPAERAVLERWGHPFGGVQ